MADSRSAAQAAVAMDVKAAQIAKRNTMLVSFVSEQLIYETAKDAKCAKKSRKPNVFLAILVFLAVLFILLDDFWFLRWSR